MEPGHEDREYETAAWAGVAAGRASMEPGHEDREYSGDAALLSPAFARLNGARS